MLIAQISDFHIDFLDQVQKIQSREDALRRSTSNFAAGSSTCSAISVGTTTCSVPTRVPEPVPVEVTESRDGLATST